MRPGIFNRSYYEEVLIVRVHPEILASQRIPECTPDSPKVWKHRYRSINDLEQHLHSNGTKIVKFFLHLSKEEQRQRFLARIDDPDKNWKFSRADLDERKLWDKYMAAYEDCLSATSTKHGHWHIVPADDKPNARLIIAQVILDALASMKLRYPTTSDARRKELLAIRKQLAKLRYGPKDRSFSPR
jgi:polyphosphate kinase 2 (PPK2 family)